LSWKDLQAVVQSPTFDLNLSPEQKAAEIVAANLPTEISREQVEKFEAHLSKMPQVPLKAEHYFADGVVVRSLFRPAGTVIVGKLHRKSHVFIVHAGEVTALTGGNVMRRIKGPYVESSPAGIKRLVIAHTDAVLMTVHPNPNNWGPDDIAKLEAELVIAPESVVSEQ
jgi:hypothetical protein